MYSLLSVQTSNAASNLSTNTQALKPQYITAEYKIPCSCHFPLEWSLLVWWWWWWWLGGIAIHNIKVVVIDPLWTVCQDSWIPQQYLWFLYLLLYIAAARTLMLQYRDLKSFLQWNLLSSFSNLARVHCSPYQRRLHAVVEHSSSSTRINCTSVGMYNHIGKQNHIGIQNWRRYTKLT